MNNRNKGTEYEKMAGEYLKDKGYKIIECNFTAGAGEIDIIAKDRDTFVFVEVKYRKTGTSGFGEEAVTISKQKKIFMTAKYFLYKNHIPPNIKCRFDVVSINGEDINHIINAFGGI